MNQPDFTTTLVVDQTPDEVFNAINDVRGWWSEEIEGRTDKLNEIFDYHFEEVHRCQIKIEEMIPGQKVVWHVLKNYFKFTKDETEWTGTKIHFEIHPKDGKTELRFTHIGLVPAYECFNICQGAWTTYIQKSLRKLITTGKGEPNASGKPRTAEEEKLSSEGK